MKKILVIDDSELVSALLKETLHVAGYEARVAMDANQGYATAIEFHPDLILLDVQLPDVTGFELCRVLKNRDELRHIPIIMITGTAHRTEEKVKGFELGADDYVMKPFEMPELLGRIQAVLRRSDRSTPAVHPPKIQSQPVLLPSAIQEPIVVSLTLVESIRMALTEPWNCPERAMLPPVGKAYVLTAVALTVAGVSASVGGNLHVIPAGLCIAVLWGAVLIVLVVTGSILGMALSWSEGAALLSLAGLPMLLRLIGGCLLSFVTTLSPFYFTASPALFVSSLWMRRLDIFEVWSAVLLWILLRRRTQSERAKSRLLVLIVWAVAIGLIVAFERWGVGL